MNENRDARWVKEVRKDNQAKKESSMSEEKRPKKVLYWH